MGGNPNLSRHARHLALAEVGAIGQERIRNGTALLIGVGGIGCAAASYLASSGVGKLMLCDFDTVDATNLGRQILFGPDDIGLEKATLAATRLGAANPDIQITAITDRLDDAALRKAVEMADVVLDIHSGGKTLDFVPFAAAHVLDDKAQQARCVAAMEAFNAPYQTMLLEIDSHGLYDSAAENLGKVFVTTELAECTIMESPSSRCFRPSSVTWSRFPS